LIDTLSAEAGGLVGELMMNDQAQTVATEEIIKDCIHRVHTYWAQRIAQEMKELITAKLDRGEPVTKDELDATTRRSLRRVARKNPLPIRPRSFPPHVSYHDEPNHQPRTRSLLETNEQSASLLSGDALPVGAPLHDGAL
jgi:hypothetical protein